MFMQLHRVHGSLQIRVPWQYNILSGNQCTNSIKIPLESILQKLLLKRIRRTKTRVLSLQLKRHCCPVYWVSVAGDTSPVTFTDDDSRSRFEWLKSITTSSHPLWKQAKTLDSNHISYEEILSAGRQSIYRGIGACGLFIRSNMLIRLILDQPVCYINSAVSWYLIMGTVRKSVISTDRQMLISISRWINHSYARIHWSYS